MSRNKVIEKHLTRLYNFTSRNGISFLTGKTTTDLTKFNIYQKEPFNGKVYEEESVITLSFKPWTMKRIKEQLELGPNEILTKYAITKIEKEERTLQEQLEIINTSIFNDFKLIKRIHDSNRNFIKDRATSNSFAYFTLATGSTEAGDVLRFPIALYKLEIELNIAKHTATLTIQNNPYPNKPVISMAANKNKKSLKALFDYEEIQHELTEEQRISQFIDIYKYVGISIDFEDIDYSIVDKVTSLDKKDIDKKQHHFTIENIAGIQSINTLSDAAIFSDVSKIDETEIVKILEPDPNRLYKKSDMEETFTESDIKLFAESDIFQQRAINMAMNETPTVIQGPPGTGKSATIVNLLLNIIHSNKKVLFVSEKKTALDVIYNRLESQVFDLSFSALNLSLRNDKKEFFGQFGKLDEAIDFEFDKNLDVENISFQDSLTNLNALKELNEKVRSDFFEYDLDNFKTNDLLEFWSKQDYEKALKFKDINDYEYVVAKKVFSENISKMSEDFSTKNPLKVFGELLEAIKSDNAEEILTNYEITGKVNKPSMFKKRKVSKNRELGKELLKKISRYSDIYEDILNFDFDKYSNEEFGWIEAFGNKEITTQEIELYVNSREALKNYESEQERYNELISLKGLREVVLESASIQEDNVLAMYNKLSNQVRIKYEKNSSGMNTIIKMGSSGRKRFGDVSKFIYNNIELLLDIYPIIIATTDEVAAMLPNEKNLFDYVVFDEASQIFLERAIPSLYRSDKVTVVGDTKQLKPSLFFSSRFSDDEDEGFDSLSDSIEAESLLDFYVNNGTKTNVMLKGHYRSKFRELIDFSNKEFYDDELWFMNSSSMWNKPIQVHDVVGSWNSKKGINEGEIKSTIELLEKIGKDQIKNNVFKSVGVVAFNVKMKAEIQKQIEVFNSEGILHLLKGRNSVDELFIKNVEEVQGDERDIIVFVIGYDETVSNYGPLSIDGGENRLNVAITRSKEQVHIVKSTPADDLYGENSSNQGPKLFKKYLQYAEKVSRNIVEYEEPHFDSKFEEDLFNRLNDELDSSYKVRTQVQDSKFRIDMVIYKDDSPILAIECDGEPYHSSSEQREKDLFRQNYLESRGWTFHRIWYLDWKGNEESILSDIKNQISLVEDLKSGSEIKLDGKLNINESESFIDTAGEASIKKQEKIQTKPKIKTNKVDVIRGKITHDENNFFKNIEKILEFDNNPETLKELKEKINNRKPIQRGKSKTTNKYFTTEGISIIENQEEE